MSNRRLWGDRFDDLLAAYLPLEALFRSMFYFVMMPWVVGPLVIGAVLAAVLFDEFAHLGITAWLDVRVQALLVSSIPTQFVKVYLAAVALLVGYLVFVAALNWAHETKRRFA